jgi:hypothetical protein
VGLISNPLVPNYLRLIPWVIEFGFMVLFYSFGIYQIRQLFSKMSQIYTRKTIHEKNPPFCHKTTNKFGGKKKQTLSRFYICCLVLTFYCSFKILFPRCLLFWKCIHMRTQIYIFNIPCM